MQYSVTEPVYTRSVIHRALPTVLQVEIANDNIELCEVRLSASSFWRLLGLPSVNVPVPTEMMLATLLKLVMFKQQTLNLEIATTSYQEMVKLSHQ